VSECMPTPAAAYSLRSLDGSTSTNVVRLRRASDNAESDFTAADLVGSVEGAELVTNGRFDTDSDWTKGTGWTISGGQASLDGTQVSFSGLAQNGVFEADAGDDKDIFVLSLNVVACSSFPLMRLQWGTVSAPLSTLGISSTGVHKLIMDTTLSSVDVTKIQFQTAVNGVTVTIDDVSVKRYSTLSAAESWAMESGAVTVSGTVFGTDSSNSALVTTLYDQASTNDATQSTAAAQPKLITAGVTELDNGKPAMVFDGTDDWLTLGTDQLGSTELFADSSDRFAIFSVEKGSTGTVLSKSPELTATRDLQIGYLSGNFYYNIRGTETSVAGTVGVQKLRVFNWDGSSAVANIDSGADESVGVGSAAKTTTDINIGSRTDGSFLLDGTIQEIIVYASDQSANRTILETNINDHYGIY